MVYEDGIHVFGNDHKSCFNACAHAYMCSFALKYVVMKTGMKVLSSRTFHMMKIFVIFCDLQTQKLEPLNFHTQIFEHTRWKLTNVKNEQIKMTKIYLKEKKEKFCKTVHR